MRTFKRLLRRLVPPVMTVAFLYAGCRMPGCGPGDIPRNPISSNLVDYTVPATGSVVRWAGTSRREDFKIYFLRSIDTGSFSMGDDMAMCRIPPAETTCDPADPAQALDVSEHFEFRGWNSHGGLFAGIFTLNVRGEAFEEGGYLVRLKAGGASPLESEQGERLEDDVDVYLQVVSEDAPWQMVTIESNSLEDGIEDGYYRPHHPLKVEFSRPMQVINFEAEPLPGFYFRYLYGESDPEHPVGIESRSAQGLMPGQRYRFSIFSSDSMPNGVPWTMDTYGNVLMESTDGAVRFASYSREFETSHVRIWFPNQEAFSDEAAPWLEQQEGIGHVGKLFVLVEVYKDVDRLTAEGPGQNPRRSHIVFADRPVTLEEKTDDYGRLRERSTIRLDIDPEAIEECAKTEDGRGYTMELGHRQALEVFAWHRMPDGHDEYRGSDWIYVDPLPADFIPDLPSGYRYLGDYPSDDENGFSEELQGMAHDENNWYFSTKSDIWKIPKYYYNLGEVWGEDHEKGIFKISIYDTYLSEPGYGYNHFGDIDYIPVSENSGYIIAPVDDSPGHNIVPMIAFFYTDASGGPIEFIGSGHLWEQEWKKEASWCAYNPLDGLIYSSGSIKNNQARSIKKYSFSFSDNSYVYLQGQGQLFVQDGSYWPRRLPRDENGEIFLESVQGGVFSQNGNLYLVTGYYDENCINGEPEKGIWVFELNDNNTNAYLRSASCINDGCPFYFDYDSSCTSAEEAEGIDIWDLDNDTALNIIGIVGQLHVIILNNDAVRDNWYLKHYTVTDRSEKCRF